MFCKSPIHFWLLQPTDNFLINKKERKAVIVTAIQLRAPTEDTFSVPTFFLTTLTLHQQSRSSNMFLEQGINSLILQLYRRISKQMNPDYN